MAKLRPLVRRRLRGGRLRYHRSGETFPHANKFDCCFCTAANQFLHATSIRRLRRTFEESIPLCAVVWEIGHPTLRIEGCCQRCDMLAGFNPGKLPLYTEEFKLATLDKDCPLCRVVRQIFYEFEDISPTITLRHGTEMDMTVTVSGAPPRLLAWYLVYTTHPTTLAGCLPPYRKRVDISTAVSFVNKNLSECVGHHAHCQQQIQPLPRRVLDIGTWDQDVKLVETKAIKAHYATLSHCWGDPELQPLKTTRSSLDNMLRRIPFGDLPVVFAEAITVARKLGIRFIWIDSLCIVQDSPEDWEEEAAKMGDYYLNSFLTISTASSPSHNVPFLTQRDPKWSPISSPVRVGGKPHKIFARWIGPSTSPTEMSGKLATRAWAYQESVLSPRAIHFNNDGLVWTCRDEILAEHRLPARFSYDNSISPSIQRLFFKGHRQSLFWESAVHAYSQRDLTYIQDRLPAISGIAALYGRMTGAKYLGGLWGDALLAQLCWSRLRWFRDEVLQPQVAEYLGPSWTWASIVWRVQWQGSPRYASALEQHFEEEASVVEAACTVKGSNPYGVVSAGHIILEGFVLRGHLKSDSGPLTSVFNYHLSWGTSWGLCVDCLLEQDGESVKRYKGTASLGEIPPRVSGKVWCLMVGTFRHEMDDTDHISSGNLSFSERDGSEDDGTDPQEDVWVTTDGESCSSGSERSTPPPSAGDGGRGGNGAVTTPPRDNQTREGRRPASGAVDSGPFAWPDGVSTFLVLGRSGGDYTRLGLASCRSHTARAMIRGRGAKRATVKIV